MVRMRNWARTVEWEPVRVVEPAGLEAVVHAVDEVRRRRGRLRVIGSGHSFTPLAVTDDTLLRLDRHRGLVRVGGDRATVRAGTKLAELGPALADHGVAQENLGDIDEQALAGAVATGTHGTGADLGSIATQVTGLRIVTGTGDVLEVSGDDDPDLLAGGVVSLGALGVVAEIQLRVVPAFRLHYRTEGRDLDRVLAEIHDLARRHRHVEFFWLPYSGRAQVKVQDVTDRPPTGGVRRWVNETVVENLGLGAMSEAARTVPRLAPAIGRLQGRLIGSDEGVAASYEVFANRRWNRFNEMEYSVPADRVTAVLVELGRVLHERRLPVHFPIEVRFVAADDLWLSPAYGRDSAYIAIHTYRDMPFREYFLAAEEIFRAHEGRPHWGKVHSLGADQLRDLYPRWDDFLALRQRLDPDGIFLNDHLERLLGAG